MKINNHQAKALFCKAQKHRSLCPPEMPLYGGHTSTIKLRHTVAEDENVSYMDVGSLYPYAMCGKEYFYPLGHPQILYEDF